MMRKLTDAEMMQRVWDVYQIKNVMGRHAYYHAYGLHERELDEIWVRKPENQATASFGQNWGYQVGMDLIRRNYAEANRLMQKKALQALRAKYPELEDAPENYGVGSMLMHALTTPYIEVAGDGKTAQGVWYSPGQVTVTRPDRVEAVYMYERYGVDFIKEDGEWKIWHLFVGTDFVIKPGALMKEQPVDLPEFNLYQEDEETSIELTYAFEAYTSRYNYFRYPAIPKPYETFDEVISNGPEGNPNFKKFLEGRLEK